MNSKQFPLQSPHILVFLRSSLLQCLILVFWFINYFYSHLFYTYRKWNKIQEKTLQNSSTNRIRDWRKTTTTSFFHILYFIFFFTLWSSYLFLPLFSFFPAFLHFCLLSLGCRPQKLFILGILALYASEFLQRHHNSPDIFPQSSQLTQILQLSWYLCLLLCICLLLQFPCFWPPDHFCLSFCLCLVCVERFTDSLGLGTGST